MNRISDVWSKTVLFVMYDENDGFFDHVPPATAPPGTAGEYLTVNPLPAGGRILEDAILIEIVVVEDAAAALLARRQHRARLVIPVKYGIKNLKRIGKIFFSDKRPRDYWAEQGYDWFAGL